MWDFCRASVLMWRRGTDLAPTYTVPVLRFARRCLSRLPSSCILFMVLCGLVALWNVLRESMLTGTRECRLERTVTIYIFARSVAVTGPAKWCILSGSPAGIHNSHLKFYVAWLTVDSVRVECRVMNVCVSVFWILTPFSVVEVLRSVIRMYCLRADGDCSSITCLLPCQTT